MKLNKLTILLGTLILLLSGIYMRTKVLAASQGLSEEEITKQYGITFPVGELGNCTTIAECGSYCRKDGNLPSCMEFVKKHSIVKEDVLSFSISELGGCQMGTDCRNFCNRPENITPCIDFADKYDLLSTSNIEIARKFTAAVGDGGPGGCRTLEQCERYCDDST
ncbi:hypothetical protein HY612_04705, partial [Candidatus Roizmanbacteria bacterium]|nr:hypothetical protein [Candidatus Roizmanbacteria bacterium]